MATTVKHESSSIKKREEIHAFINGRYGFVSILIMVVVLLASSTSIGLIQDEVPVSRSSVPSGSPPFNEYGYDPSQVNVSTSTTSLYPNPYEIYQTEPAPMGLTDYGLGFNGKPYAYETSSFLGTARIGNLSVSNSSLGPYPESISLQLNLNLVFKSSGSLYVYWIQDVANLNASSHYISFADNVWNFSASDQNVYSSAVTGNGTIGMSKSTYFYYDLAGANLSGNDIQLGEPLTLKLMSNVSVDSNNVPVVDFMYNDGYGWVVYDHVTFVVAKHLESTPEFVVNGFQYEPTGYTFYDAELILGGPGGGSTTQIDRSNIQMTLDYFNGNNFQMITNAYNFGSDTAEGIGNVTVSGTYYSENGTVFSEVTAGSGSLGALYFENQVACLNITTPVSNGLLYIAGTPYFFENGRVNVTLAPSLLAENGNYNVSILTLKGNRIWSGNIRLTAGEFLSLDVNVYPLEFLERSFPNGTLWYLNLSNNQSFRSTTNEITLNLSNGSYLYTAISANKSYSAYSGSFKVSGKPLVIDIVFAPVQFRTYMVTFEESGLRSGSIWSVTLGGTTTTSTGGAIAFAVANGTYTYAIGNLSGYLVSQYSGTVTVSGENVTIPIPFSELFDIVFSESGLPPGALWYVNLTNGQSYSSYDTVISFSEVNGTYGYYIGSNDTTYRAPSGAFVVKGHSVSKSLYFTEVTYNVTFFESGLPSGIPWYINLTAGQNFSSSSSLLTIKVANGSYHFMVASSDKSYAPIAYSGTFAVNGNPVNSSIEFLHVTYFVSFVRSGLPKGIGWTVDFNGHNVSSSGVITFKESNGTFNFTISGISGYVASEYVGSIVVDGSSMIYHITWNLRTYQLVIKADRIPANDVWSVTITGTSFNGVPVNLNKTSTTDLIAFDLPNGTYSYSVLLPLGLTTDKSEGTFNITGNQISENIVAHQGVDPLLVAMVTVTVVVIVSIGLIFLHKRNKSVLIREKTK